MFTNFFVHFGLIVTYLLLVNMLVLPILFRIYLYIFQCATKYFTYKKVFCQYFLFTIKYFLVGSNGIEPSTSRLSGVRSNHLSYEPIF